MCNYNVEFFVLKQNDINYLPGRLSYNQIVENVANGVDYRAMLESDSALSFLTLDSIESAYEGESVYAAVFRNQFSGDMVFTNDDPDQPLEMDLRS